MNIFVHINILKIQVNYITIYYLMIQSWTLKHTVTTIVFYASKVIIYFNHSSQFLP